MGVIERERMRATLSNYHRQEQSKPDGLVSRAGKFVTAGVWEMK
jgi:hypothetical protein